jgi:hypothetical protein
MNSKREKIAVGFLFSIFAAAFHAVIYENDNRLGKFPVGVFLLDVGVMFIIALIAFIFARNPN